MKLVDSLDLILCSHANSMIYVILCIPGSVMVLWAEKLKPTLPYAVQNKLVPAAPMLCFITAQDMRHALN